METKTVSQGRDGCTVTAASEVVFPIRKDYYHVRNDSENTVYASVFSAELDPAEDGVYAVPAGGNIAIKSHGSDRVYVSGGVTVIGTGSAVCPFKSAQRGGDITAKGNPVQLDGLQGGVPFSEITVSGKNLLKYPYVNTTKTVNGITFTDNGDGTITANGTATATASYFLDSEFNYIGGITYTISGCPKGGSNSTYKIKGDRLGAYIDDNGNGATYSFKYDTTAAIVILIYKDTTVDNIVFRPQLELGDTATAYEPPITGRALKVNVSGKNLLKYPYVNTTKTVNGITFTDNGDGTITANGTATDMVNFAVIWKNLHIPKGTYTISGCPKGGNVNTGFFIVCGTDSIRFVADTGNGGTFDIENDINDFTFSLRINSGVTVSNLIFRPQLEIGSTATDYEPYHGAEYTITPDSNPYTVPNDIRQQDGLNTVSVSAGTLSVTGVRKNAAIKRIWDEINEIKTAIIVSNGESE